MRSGGGPLLCSGGGPLCARGLRSARPSIRVNRDDRVVGLDGPRAEGEGAATQPHAKARANGLHPPRRRWCHLMAKHIIAKMIVNTLCKK